MKPQRIITLISLSLIVFFCFNSCTECECANNGTPIQDGNDCDCQCEYPWDGEDCNFCTLTPDDCPPGATINYIDCRCKCDTSLTCLNGGQYIDCECDCPPGFGGAQCQIDSAIFLRKNMFFKYYRKGALQNQWNFEFDVEKSGFDADFMTSFNSIPNSFECEFGTSFRFLVSVDLRGPLGIRNCGDVLAEISTQTGFRVTCANGWLELDTVDLSQEILKANFDFKLVDTSNPGDSVWVKDGWIDWKK